MLHFKVQLLNYNLFCSLDVSEIETTQNNGHRKVGRKEKSTDFKTHHNQSQKVYYDSRKDDPEYVGNTLYSVK